MVSLSLTQLMSRCGPGLKIIQGIFNLLQFQLQFICTRKDALASNQKSHMTG